MKELILSREDKKALVGAIRKRLIILRMHTSRPGGKAFLDEQKHLEELYQKIINSEIQLNLT